MRIDYDKKFLKAFDKLSEKNKKQTIRAIEKFKDAPFYPSLHNHGLSGFLMGKRAISVNDDIRIIFSVKDNYLIVLFLDVGPHEKVYK